MSDVFVSYKAEDRRRVQPLVEALQADGLSVWWDEHLGTGEAWRETIERQLDSAACVLVIWSKRSVGPEGRFVREEASRALARDAYVPVLFDSVQPPLGFGESQATSLRSWHGGKSDPRYQAVLAAIRQHVGEGSSLGAPHAVASRIDRRAVLAAGAVATAAIVGAGGWVLLKPWSAEAASDSIAVLPFANLSGDPAQAYFSDGIAEELRSALARLAGLKVVGRTSSEAVRNDDAETAAKKLGVSNILTGSVRQSPSTIRVSAQLVDGASGMESWSQNYDRAPGDSIKIQTDIAENVARALRIALGSAAQAALTVGGTQNAAAQNLYFEADQIQLETRQDSERAIALLDQAIALDRNYAQAIALKAIFLILLVNRFASSPGELTERKAEAERLARQSIRMAPNMPIGHGALAMIHAGYLRIAPSLAEHKKAFTLAPSEPDAIRSYSSFLSKIGRASEAIRLAEQAVTLDPLEPFSYSTLASVLWEARRYAQSVSTLENFKRESPELFSAPIILGIGLMMLGRTEESARAFADASDVSPFRLVGEAVLAARASDRSAAMRKMERLKALYGDAASYQYAEIHAQLGEVDEAVMHLERAWEIKDAGLLSMLVDPWLDPLRKDARFALLLKKMNFPA